MADLNKFEKMLELLVNEETEAAQELFHEIVVEKSRDIYEGLLESEAEDEDDEDEAVDESKDEEKDDEEMDESFDLDEFEVSEEDPMDAMMSDIAPEGGDDEGGMDMDMDMGDEEGEDDVEDRVEDLEQAFQDLQAEFEKMMAGEDGDDEAGDDMDMDMDMDDEGGDDEGEEESIAFEETDEDDEDEKKESKSAGETMKEYVEKVTASMGDNGANTKPIVAGKNDMGGTAGNLNQSGAEAGVEANKGNLKGSALSDQNPKDMSTGNINVPGGKAAKAMKSASKPKMGDTGTNGTRSTIGQ